MRLACLQSAAGFLGRPPFRGARGREVNSSRAATKSGLPSGRPVCVECRNRFTSAADSASAMKFRHSAAVDRFRQRSVSSSGSGFVRPQWVVALETISARSGVATRRGCGRFIGRRTEEGLRLAFISGSRNPHPLFAKNAKRRVGHPQSSSDS
jgi:hypothetical protein